MYQSYPPLPKAHKWAVVVDAVVVVVVAAAAAAAAGELMCLAYWGGRRSDKI
jgi:hypothetical protein